MLNMLSLPTTPLLPYSCFDTHDWLDHNFWEDYDRQKRERIQAIDLSLVETIECPEKGCAVCRNMCHVPCTPTPAEAVRIIEHGLGDRLGFAEAPDASFDKRVTYLAPSMQGNELGKIDRYTTPGDDEWCTFYKEGQCQLHELGLKPLEGRAADCTRTINNHISDIARAIDTSWDSEAGRTVVKRWMERYEVKPLEEQQVMDREFVNSLTLPF